MKIITFDTEATGLNTATDQIIEITIQHSLEEDSEIYTRRIKPGVPITPGAFKVHNISAQDLADSPSFSELAPEIVRKFEEAEAIMAYNVRFDIELLQSELQRAGLGTLDLTNKLLLDPLAIWKRYERRDLSTAYERFVGEKLENAHSAEADVKATVAVFKGMRKHFQLEETALEELSRATVAPEWIGLSHHLQWKEGRAVIAFGKHKGKELWRLAQNESSYLEWIVNKADFAPHVKEVCKMALQAEEEGFSSWVGKKYPAPR